MLFIKPKAMPDFTDLTIEDGRLRLLKVIGSGSYGIVYQAIDTTSSKHDPIFYAVKCLQKTALNEAQMASQFHEITLHSKVSGHPNVLTYHRTYEEDSYLFIILDLSHGGDLFDAITKKKAYHRNDYLAKAAILQLIDAVSSCHDAGVFHRDLKPENILCGPNGLDIRLADFGLATDKHTSQDFGCGSLIYMSPGKYFSPFMSISTLTYRCPNRVYQARVWTTPILDSP
jgi:serine/threonine protein kinase